MSSLHFITTIISIHSFTTIVDVDALDTVDAVLSGTYISNSTSDIWQNIQNGLESAHENHYHFATPSPNYIDSTNMGIDNFSSIHPINIWSATLGIFLNYYIQDPFHLTVSETIEMYSDLHNLNNRLQSSDYPMEILSAFVLCDGCSELKRTGPISNNQSSLFLHQPISVHQVFDLQSIVQIFDDDSLDIIVIHTSYYHLGGRRCHSAHTLFPNAQQHGCKGPLTVGSKPDYSYGNEWFLYDDVDKLLSDIGNPHEWEETLGGYYFYDYTEKDPSEVYYLGHIGVICSNQNICDDFLNGTTETIHMSTQQTATESTVQSTVSEPVTFDDKLSETKYDDTWKIVSIVFIIAFGVALLVLIALVVRLKRSHGGSAQIHDATKKVGGKKYIQTSTHDVI